MGLAGLGGLAQGFTQGLRLQSDLNERQAERERQAKLDAMREEEMGFRRNEEADRQRERDNRLAIEKAVADSANAGKVDNNAAALTYTNDAGEQATAYQPDAQAAQAAAQQDAIERGMPMPGADQPNAPKIEQASSVRTLDGGRKLFTGLTAAQQAKSYADENAPGSYAKYMALSEKLATMAGGQELADKYLARAKQADKEGAFKALSLLNADKPDEALKVWNSTGAARLQDGQTFKTVVDKAGNKTHQVVDRDGKVLVPDAEAALVRHISGIEGVVSAANAKSAAQAKIREELYKPYTLKPGERREVVDPATGKTVTLSQGNVPAGYEVMTDANGNTILRKMDGGGGSAGAGKGKVDDPLKATQDLVFDIIKESSAKGSLEPSQVARANTLGRQLVASAARDGRSLDNAVAAELAINAATGKIPVTPAFNPNTGAIDNVVEYQGNNFAVENLGTVTSTRLDPKQMAAVSTNFISKLDDNQRSQLVPAAFNAQARGKLEADLDARVRSQEGIAGLTARLGRAPTEDEIAKASAAAKASIAPQLELISRWGPKDEKTGKMLGDILQKSGYSRTGGPAAPAATNTGGASQQVGGLYQRPTLEQRRQRVDDARAKLAAEDAELARTAPIEAQRLLSAGNSVEAIQALAQFQASPAFNKLDRQTKTAIYNRVNGLQ